MHLRDACTIRLLALLAGLCLRAGTPMAQGTLADVERKLSRLKDGKGYLIEDFTYFRDQVVDRISYAVGKAEGPLGETLRKRADSLFAVLRESRSVSMPKDDLPLVKHFPGVDEGPRVIANLSFTLSRLGGSRSLEYAVHKGDTVAFEYSILRGKGFDEIDVLEGKEVRFTSARNPKRQVVSGVFVVEADGLVTVNLANKSPMPSKGKLLITLRPALVKLSMRYLCDTLTQLVKTKVVWVDTLPETLFSRYLRLTPRADITRPPAVGIAIPLTAGRRYLAWGYWVGTQPKSLAAWRALAAADTFTSPLALYLTRELRRRERLRLPEDSHRELRFDIRYGEVSLRRIATGAAGPDMAVTDIHPNYCAIALGEEASALRIDLELENLSRHYACQAQVDIVGVYAESREEEREVEEKSCREYIKLTIL